MVIPAAMLACPNLAVPAAMMHHVAMVESSGDPYAIGVVGGRLIHQPGTVAEAVATAQALESQGYNFSVGVAQVNRANLTKYGLDSYQKAFSICDNLEVGSRILAECRARNHGAWDKALSCYYSGDPATGLRDGYVQKVFASLDAARTSGRNSGSAPAPPMPVTHMALSASASTGRIAGAASSDAASRRVGRRSLPLGSVDAVDLRAGLVVDPLSARTPPATVDAGSPSGAGVSAVDRSAGASPGASVRTDGPSQPPFRPRISAVAGVATGADPPSLGAATGAVAPASSTPPTEADAAFVF